LYFFILATCFNPNGSSSVTLRENTTGCMTLKELVTYFKLFDVVHAQLKV